jgi:hypothetical protein
MNKLYDLLNNIRPLINASGLEKAAKLPKNALGKHYRWADGKDQGRAISIEHGPDIVRALCEVFGTIEIGGWTIWARFEEPGIFGHRPIADREVESKEIEMPGQGTHFEYLAPEYRTVWDDFDFATYVLNQEA